MTTDEPTVEDLENVLAGLAPDHQVIDLASFEPSVLASGEALARRTPTS